MPFHQPGTQKPSPCTCVSCVQTTSQPGPIGPSPLQDKALGKALRPRDFAECLPSHVLSFCLPTCLPLALLSCLWGIAEANGRKLSVSGRYGRVSMSPSFLQEAWLAGEYAPLPPRSTAPTSGLPDSRWALARLLRSGWTDRQTPRGPHRLQLLACWQC